MSMMGEGISSQVDGEKQTRKKMVYLSSRCGVQEFCGLVESLSDDKKVILDMGFGRLLHLKKHKLKMQLLEDLMMRGYKRLSKQIGWSIKRSTRDWLCFITLDILPRARGVDCIQVGFGGDAGSCFKIEDIKVEIGLLRNEFQKDMHSTKSQLGELKKEMFDAMSQIITTLGTIQSQLQSGGPKIIIEDEPTNVHVFTRKQEEVRIDANGTINGDKKSGDNLTTIEDSTNLYDKLNNIVHDLTKKEDNIELSDDASSPLQLSKAKRNHLGKQGNKTTDAIPSQNEKKIKANQHEEDETDSFERLMAGVNQKIRSREDSNMGLRKKDVLKAGPQFQFPYVATKPAVRGRGRQQGPKQQGTKKGGRSKKKKKMMIGRISSKSKKLTQIR
ncbi:unnamed protein product [Linum trigynum]|uniref:Uncharacterized protein n=1 Tax=Linum trigynum TaxID=586398 RepID=A0AAV2G229_9ROSI